MFTLGLTVTFVAISLPLGEKGANVTQATPIPDMLARWATSHISGGNAEYVDALYEVYLRTRTPLRPSGAIISISYPACPARRAWCTTCPIRYYGTGLPGFRRCGCRTDATAPHDSHATEYERKQVRVVQLISAYRQRGHQQAQLDPLGLSERPTVPDLTLSFHELSEADLDTTFQVGTVYFGRPEATLAQIRADLEATYCGTVGAEFMHIVDTEERHWIMSRMEAVRQCA